MHYWTPACAAASASRPNTRGLPYEGDRCWQTGGQIKAQRSGHLGGREQQVFARRSDRTGRRHPTIRTLKAIGVDGPEGK